MPWYLFRILLCVPVVASSFDRLPHTLIRPTVAGVFCCLLTGVASRILRPFRRQQPRVDLLLDLVRPSNESTWIFPLVLLSTCPALDLRTADRSSIDRSIPLDRVRPSSSTSSSLVNKAFPISSCDSILPFPGLSTQLLLLRSIGGSVD